MKSEFTYQIGDEIRTVTIQREGDCFQVTVGDKRYQIRAQRPEHGRLNLQVGDRRLRAHVASDGPRRYVALAGQTWTLERPQPQQKRRGAAAGGPGAGSLEAAMPGLVLDVLVAEGDEVHAGPAAGAALSHEDGAAHRRAGRRPGAQDPLPGRAGGGAGAGVGRAGAVKKGPGGLQGVTGSGCASERS
jgi:biotin carboxyl carrier protein